jgi:Outer membrane receptor proteins, mostly Fe transport
MQTTRKLIKGLATLGAVTLALPGFGQATADDSDLIVRETFTVTEMKAFSDQAIPGETPVAFTELGKDVITRELGSRDIPLVLNSAPSVFATADGGAAGDARVNVRGFSQRNVGILINGVPTNDIENGWLYWSNWDVLGDVTSTIQIQRGLSNVSLPTPSIGGTMNIITDPTATHRGGSAKVEFGSDHFFKATGVVNTGLLQDKFALTVAGMAKTGEGYPNGAWSRGLGYYIGATWIVNENHRLELFALGAPQRHGQRSFASNIAAYSIAEARAMGFTDEQIYSTASGADAGALRQGPINAGFNYNQNVAPVSRSYAGKQFYWGGLHSREDPDHINERENYFHKPQVNLNWYATISPDVKLTSVFYYSGGRGGGAGTLNNGSSSAAFARYPNTVAKYGSNINWDATIASNAGAVAANGTAKTAGQSLGILRNSVNNQDQFGAVSKLSYEVTPELTLTAGLDWRTAKIDHFREVRDLLGGDYYLPTVAQASEFWADGANTKLGLGDKVDYFNTNEVDWLAGFLTAQYDAERVHAFGVYGYSVIDYKFIDHFRRAAPGSSEKYTLNPGSTDGHQIKGGLSYDLSNNLSAFANAGWVSKTPIFDGVINDTVGTLVNGSKNEKFTSFETGLRWTSDSGKFNVSANAYFTKWRDRTVSVTNESADTITYLRGVDSNYNGVEIESAYRPNKFVRFDLAASFGNWKYTDDVEGEVFAISTGQQTSGSPVYYIDGVSVGDAPQTQIALGTTVYPANGLSVKVLGRWYDRYYSDFTPESRTVVGDRENSWQIPDYLLFDLHINYDLPSFSNRFDVSVFFHVFNLLDETYISDATDESSFESVGLNLASRHSAQRAEVFFGAPRSFNAGVMVRF